MISNKGFNEGIITLYVETDTSVGIPVVMTESHTCGSAADGDTFIGVLANERAGVGAVQVCGYVKLPYSGTDPELGVIEIAADGNGGIKQMSGGKKVTVIGINTADQTAEILM